MERVRHGAGVRSMIDEWAKEQTHGKSLLYAIQAMITEEFLKLMSPGSCRLSSSIFLSSITCQSTSGRPDHTIAPSWICFVLHPVDP
jgi:hypothetical protein